MTFVREDPVNPNRLQMFVSWAVHNSVQKERERGDVAHENKHVARK